MARHRKEFKEDYLPLTDTVRVIVVKVDSKGNKILVGETRKISTRAS